MALVVDAHQHVWDLEKVEYPWLTAELGPIFRTFEVDELIPSLREAGVDRTVLVQAADSLEDTEHMLDVADRHPDVVAGVVGWVPLTDPRETDRALDRFCAHPRFCGVRHLIHEEEDPDWLLQPSVLEGLSRLAARGLTFDVVAVLSRHLEHVPTLADSVPELRMVIDHLAKPPIAAGEKEPWATLIARAAERPNVFAKVSGLNTAAAPGWSAEDLQPYVDHALTCFGPERLMFGGDWPVATLADDYGRVAAETRRTLRALPDAAQAAVLGETAVRFYGLPDDALRAGASQPAPATRERA